jgi:hypothetical protein
MIRKAPIPDAPTAEHAAAPAAGARRSAVVAFIRARWRGAVPLRRALWWDMWCVGTIINLAAALAALLLLAAGVPDAVGALVFFAPLPYNILLLVSVWRSAARTPGPASLAAQLLAVAWIVLATLL